MQHSKIFPLIFTDLDGTLLDHNTYSAEPAATLIRSLHETASAYVMPITSKTQSELASLDQKLPFEKSVKVSENGAVIKAPPSSPPAKKFARTTMFLGVRYSEILAAIEALPDELRRHIDGFANMTSEDVSRHTGLNIDQAKEAKDRQATEPFLWSGTDDQLEDLRAHMAQRGILLQHGGRFHHLTGRATKQQALHTIMQAFQDHQPENRFASVALGDGPNDLEMIEAADFGVIIPNHAGVAISSKKPNVRTAKKPGPEGWVLAVKDILRELGMH